MFRLKDLLTSSGTYPEREDKATDEIKENAISFLSNVNAYLEELTKDSPHKAKRITSGFRPAEVNAKTKGAAKKSLHQTGQAIDILDTKDQDLAKLAVADAEKGKDSLATKYGVWIEDPAHTKGKWTNWLHLDCSKTRKGRAVRVFKP